MAGSETDPSGEPQGTKRRRDSKIMMVIGVAMIAYCLWFGREPDYQALLGQPLFLSVAVLATGAGKYSLDRKFMSR